MGPARRASAEAYVPSWADASASAQRGGGGGKRRGVSWGGDEVWFVEKSWEADAAEEEGELEGGKRNRMGSDVE